MRDCEQLSKIFTAALTDSFSSNLQKNIETHCTLSRMLVPFTVHMSSWSIIFGIVARSLARNLMFVRVLSPLHSRNPQLVMLFRRRSCSRRLAYSTGSYVRNACLQGKATVSSFVQTSHNRGSIMVLVSELVEELRAVPAHIKRD